MKDPALRPEPEPPRIRLIEGGNGARPQPDAEPTRADPDTLIASYRRLADVFHDVLSEQSLDEPNLLRAWLGELPRNSCDGAVVPGK